MVKLTKKTSLQYGQSLFEVILAIALVSIVLVTLVSVSILSLKNANFSKNKTVAARIAQESSEWLRQERDASWDTFSGRLLAASTYCMPNLNWNKIGICQQNDFIQNSIYKREVRLTSLSATEIQVETKIFWTDAQGFHDVKVITILTDWRSLK